MERLTRTRQMTDLAIIYLFEFEQMNDSWPRSTYPIHDGPLLICYPTKDADTEATAQTYVVAFYRRIGRRFSHQPTPSRSAA